MKKKIKPRKEKWNLYFAFDIAPLQLSNVFAPDVRVEMMRCCRILVVRVLDETEAMEQMESQMEIHLKLRLN